jgi:hypothetical protein
MTSAAVQLNATSPAELFVIRQEILDSAYVDDATDLKWFESLCAVENRIAEAAYTTDADKMVGLRILVEANDAPDLADEFKQKLILRLRQFS